MHAIRHLLTPGTPVYGLLKLGALGLFVALNVAVRRRSNAGEAPPEPEPETPAQARHPVSKKKKRRKR